MITEKSVVHSSFDAKNVAPLSYGRDYELSDYKDLSKIGIYGLDEILQARFGAGYESEIVAGMDTIQQPVSTPSVSTPVQFLQGWLPGFVNVITAARKIDELVGVTTIGTWEDEQIVQGYMELMGSPVLYGDLANTPLSSYNVNFATRSVVRFENGMFVGRLEQARAARMRASADESKRGGAANALEITRNQIGFWGYNSGNNATYGILNDPNLPAYQTVATGAVTSSKLWSLKTMEEIVADILTAVAAIVNQSQDTINPEVQETTLAVPTIVVQYLNKINAFGISAKNWINQTYPKMRIISMPQFNGANGGSNVFYLYADRVIDNSTDDGKTFDQLVPAKFQVLGVQQKLKGYEESYSNATAGVLCKRPYAVYRGSGI